MSEIEITVPVFAQDPMATPEPTEVTVRSTDLRSGPGDRGSLVEDIDNSAGVRYQAAQFDAASGTFPAYEPTDVRFHQLNAWAIATRTRSMVEDAVGRRIRFPFGPRITIHPHYQDDRNAFYSRDMGALAFFYFDMPFKEGKVFTSLSHDIVAHEMGHALLDGLKPGFLEAMDLESGAFHEAFGDLVAIFSSLTLEPVVSNVVGITGGDLRQDNLVSQMAEQFGYGIYGPGHFFLRNANDPVTMSTNDSYGVHGYSVLLTATMFEILAEFVEIHRGHRIVVTASPTAPVRNDRDGDATMIGQVPTDTIVEATGPKTDGWYPVVIAAEDGTVEGWMSEQSVDLLGTPLDAAAAIPKAARHLARIAARAINYLPPTGTSFFTFGQAMVSSDSRLFPADELRYRDIIKSVFVKREIASDPSELDPRPAPALIWNGDRDPASLVEFVADNRDALMIPTGDRYRLTYPTIETIDQRGLVADGAEPVQETVMEFQYYEQLADWCGFYNAYYGGTVVFDQDGQVVDQFALPGYEGGEEDYRARGTEMYDRLRAEGRVKTASWKDGDAQLGAEYLLSRGPNGATSLRRNGCSRFNESDRHSAADTPRLQLPKD